MANNYDLSDLGAKPASQYDLSDLGGVAHIQENEPQAANPPFGQRIGLDVAASFGNLGHALLNMPHDIYNKIPAYKPGYDYLGGVGVTNPNIGDKLLAQSIPVGLSLASMNPLIAGGIGFATQEGALGTRATSGALQAALSLAPKAIGSSYSTVKNALFPAAKKELSDSVTRGLINSYLEKKAGISGDYTALENDVAKRGYSTNNAPLNNASYPFTNTNVGKDFAPSGSLENKLDDISNAEGISKNLSGKLDAYKENPSYSNIHSLQTALREEASDFGSGLANSSDKQMADKLSNLRKDVKQHTQNIFINNGDKDFAQRLESLSNDYAQHIAPYMESRPIWKAIRGGKFPKNIANEIGETSLDKTIGGEVTPGTYETLRAHVAEKPDLQKQLEILNYKPSQMAEYFKRGAAHGAGLALGGTGLYELYKNL